MFVVLPEGPSILGPFWGMHTHLFPSLVPDFAQRSLNERPAGVGFQAGPGQGPSAAAALGRRGQFFPNQ